MSEDKNHAAADDSSAPGATANEAAANDAANIAAEKAADKAAGADLTVDNVAVDKTADDHDSDNTLAATRIRDSLQHWYLNQMIHALLKAIALRDAYTAEHLMNVSHLARAIAQSMGLDSEQIENIRLAGALHDIGNMGIPLEILQQQRALNSAEYTLLQQHPKVAWDILNEPDFPIRVANAVYQHHERLDGSGYPQGLQGDAICLEAQVVAVADVFDSIVTRKPYREAGSIADALEILQADSGRLFNSAAVAACVRLMGQGETPLPFCADRYNKLRKRFTREVSDDASA